MKSEYGKGACYPAGPEIFNAFRYCGPDEVRVCILGQDPYHQPGQAHGLAFSVNPGVKPPPSLQNIFKEIQADVPGTAHQTGCLESWARQGVLLLNSILTVRAGQPMSHAEQGWEGGTGAIVSALGATNPGVVYLLWGRNARAYKGLIASGRRLEILEAPHPSPFSAERGFFGCRHFSRTNAALVEAGLKPIDWST